jgi:aminoglycoside phosphotransferase family enzyme/predicted kinase
MGASAAGGAGGRIAEMTGSSTLATARARVDALGAAIARAEGSPPRLVETAISWVLLGRELAHKIKKPVRLPFLDFTSLAERQRLCAEELRINRRFAPELYLDVVAIHAGPEGASFDAAGPVIEVAVRMRRFGDGALWSERIAAGTLVGADVDVLARRLAAIHGDAAVASSDTQFGSAAAHALVAHRSIAAIEAWLRARAEPIAEWPALRAWLESERARLAPHWPLRLESGKVRECHGDLHLGNVLQLAGTPTAFDAVEFDPALRWIDPLDDVAFLTMDLLAHGRRDLAFRLLDGYLEASGDHDGLPALRFFLVSRALVRAQVGALCESSGIAPHGPCSALDYLRVAASLARGADARLAITHGLPGSGKSFVSARLVEVVGAIRARSDVERKRLFGLGALEPSRERVRDGIYGPDATRSVYARLRKIAQAALAAGWPTIVDAAFLRRDERAQFAALAAEAGVPFAIVDCRAPLALLQSRVAARQAAGSDASEADLAVLDRLAGADEPLDAGERTEAIAFDSDAPESVAALAARWDASA